MSKTLRIQTMAAPMAMQPGGYIRVAYADHVQPETPVVELAVERSEALWRISLRWRCEAPERLPLDDPQRFVDAAAVFVPSSPDTPPLTMGAKGHRVRGALWRAGQEHLFAFEAEGLGTVRRSAAPPAWRVVANHRQAHWTVRMFVNWPELERFNRLAVAVWQGARSERAGLKSISPGWVWPA